MRTAPPPRRDVVIFAVTKYPLGVNQRFGFRIGPRKEQDWYRGLVKAQQLRDTRYPGAKFLLVTAVTIDGNNEGGIYYEAMLELGIDPEDIIRANKAYETIEQLHICRDIAAERGSKLVLVSTWLHYLRVRWICMNDGVRATHYVAFGIPRPREALRDIIATFLFPAIDLLGVRERLLRRVQERRQRGEH